MKASIDCGTNSFRLLIVNEKRQVVARELRITRLGEGVHATRRLGPAAMDRSIAALAEFKRLLDQHHVLDVRAVATSAARDAGNGQEFLTRAGEVLGVDVEILSGQSEGELTFAGVSGGMPVDGPLLVVDIGGGSTELAFGIDGQLQWAQSLDIGCVRLTELALQSDPYTTEERDAACTTVESFLASSKLGQVPSRTRLVGVAGSITSLASISLGLAEYEADAVHGVELTAKTLAELTDRLALMTNADRLFIPALPAGRADVIVAGAVILQQIMARGGFDSCTISERDLLFGLLTDP